MDTKMIYEIIGYCGSALVVVSLLMTSIVKLRLFNVVGSIISCIYAFICHAIPLAVMNISLIIINVVSLYKLLNTKKTYSIVPGSVGSELDGFFFDYYKDDISVYFPHFNKEKANGQDAFYIYHECNLVGVFLGKKSDDVFEINIEYTTPAYRDCSVGKCLYETLPKYGVKTLRFVNDPSDGHIPYLNKMGYQPVNGKYEKTL